MRELSAAGVTRLTNPLKMHYINRNPFYGQNIFFPRSYSNGSLGHLCVRTRAHARVYVRVSTYRSTAGKQRRVSANIPLAIPLEHGINR